MSDLNEGDALFDDDGEGIGYVNHPVEDMLDLEHGVNFVPSDHGVAIEPEGYSFGFNGPLWGGLARYWYASGIPPTEEDKKEHLIRAGQHHGGYWSGRRRLPNYRFDYGNYKYLDKMRNDYWKNSLPKKPWTSSKYSGKGYTGRMPYRRRYGGRKYRPKRRYSRFNKRRFTRSRRPKHHRRRRFHRRHRSHRRGKDSFAAGQVSTYTVRANYVTTSATCAIGKCAYADVEAIKMFDYNSQLASIPYLPLATPDTPSSINLSTGTRGQRIYMKAKATYVVFNQNPHPVMVTLYIVKPRMATSIEPTTAVENGLTALGIVNPTTNLLSYPEDSFEFKKLFKVVKKKKKLIGANGRFGLSKKGKWTLFEPFIYSKVTSDFNPKYPTWACFARIHGDWMVSSTTVAEGSTNIGRVHFAGEQTIKMKYDAGIPAQFLATSNNMLQTLGASGNALFRPIIRGAITGPAALTTNLGGTTLAPGVLY